MCVKEVQRWRPVVIQGFPHYTTRDEVYKQYLYELPLPRRR